MPLPLGHRLAHYQILQLIGKGGMGEVYRARGLQLDREIAIKVLPDEFSEDRQRLARFEREAKVLASLNHPNIAAIHGVEETNNTLCLILELVPGETLAERISRGPIPMEQALAIARQIVAALELAHEKAIVHRDLKPANIKLTPDGDVKVLDFGLAKGFVGDGEVPADASQSPTLTKGTALGAIMGTAAYMSPEQARGQSVDKRSDIWAFGVVLFEMLTGKRLFEGETVSDTLAAVLKNDFDESALPAGTPEAVRRLLRRCLEKDRKRRLPDIGVARLEIDDARSKEPSSSSETPRRNHHPVTLGFAALGLVLLGAFAGRLLTSPAPSAPRQVMRLTVPLPPSQVMGVSGLPLLAISRDGSQIVYVANQQLYLRRLSEEVARPLEGTEGASAPFFSPDGQWIGFNRNQRLEKVSVAGGAPVTIANVDFFTGASWGFGDTIVFSEGGSLYRVPASGGAPELLLRANGGEIATNPVLLPDGSAVLFSEVSRNGLRAVALSLKSGARHVLLENGSGPRYLATGRLLYRPNDNIAELRAVAFDPDRLEVSGTGVPVLSGVLANRGIGAVQVAVSDSGTLAYLPAPEGLQRTLVWVDRQGREEALPLAPGNYALPAISPDGSRLAISQMASAVQSDVWISDLTKDTMTRLTFSGNNRGTVWAPDGRSVAFMSNRERNPGLFGNIFRKPADGTGDAEPVTTGDSFKFPYGWSRNGQLVLVEMSPETKLDVRMLDLGAGTEPTTLIGTPYSDTRASLSPDERWIAYTSDESGQDEVYVRPFPDVDAGRWQVSTHGGHSPRWVRDTGDLVYRGNGKLMSVDVDTSSGFSYGIAEPLFDDVYANDTGGMSYDVSADGKRFLMIKEGATGNQAREIRVIVNWFQELERLVPRNGN